MASEGLKGVHFGDVRGKRLLVALSGGADSVALLCLLARRQQADGIASIHAAHLHHGIRGAEADGDLRLCRELCARMDIPLTEGHADVPRIAREKGVGLETAAREARYAFLEEARSRCGADIIALAHHLDDQAETILMHLFRGAGPMGVCGMARMQGRLYRPLLEVRKAELKEFLENSGLDWREDASNAVSDNPRNALRLNVLPEIEKSYPSAASAIARYGRIAQIESDFVARQAESFLMERLERGPWGLRLSMDGALEEAILRRAILSILGKGLSAGKLEEILVLIKSGRGKLEISGDLTAEFTNRRLYFLPKGKKEIAPAKINLPGETLLPGVCRLTAEIGNFPFAENDRDTECFEPSALEGTVLRCRRDGDRFHPLGAPGERLLSDYFTDRKIDRPLRDYLPLVAIQQRVLWVCGVGMSETARVVSDGPRARLSVHHITDDNAEVGK